MNRSSQTLQVLVREVRACKACEPSLPFGARPVLQIDASARLLIVGQAPGRRVHASGKPFDDPSGVRLRRWLGISEDCFYDPKKVALLPMGFCYPGTGKNGDLPPRVECAKLWRQALLEHLKKVSVTLLLGQYAIAWHLGHKGTLTSAVQAWREHAPKLYLAPHPSPRNQVWLRRNPWFEAELLPSLRSTVQERCGLGR